MRRNAGMPTLAQTPRPLPPPTAVEMQSLDALQSQIAEVSAQLAGNRAEQAILERQLRMHRNDPAVDQQLVARYAQVTEKVARGEADVDRLASQIAQLKGVPRTRISDHGTMTNPQPVLPRRGPDPDMVFGMSFTLAMCFVLPLSIAFARRIWRGKRDTGAIIEDRVSQRLDRLEQAVDTIAVEVERISEGQRFVTKVLVERPQSSNKPPVAAETNDAGVNEVKPFLALGAGPVEPIRMAERQAVRQSITPH